MLSLIICSRNAAVSAELAENIKNTIGIEYELIVIDNSDGRSSIFSAYNKGVEKSQFPYLCFMHEDIGFHTEGWGKMLCEHLSDPTCGFAGVSGGTLMPRIPASWSSYKMAAHFIQSDWKHSTSEFVSIGTYNAKLFMEVVALDGMFLAARKALFMEIRFDDQSFDGFHCYDTDICLQAYVMGYHNRVVNDILIEHFSKGFPDRKWIENSKQLHSKWKMHLPISIEVLPVKQLERIEILYMMYIYLKRMIRASYSTTEIRQTILEYLQHIPSTRTTLFLLKLQFRIYRLRLTKKPLSLIPHLR